MRLPNNVWRLALAIPVIAALPSCASGSGGYGPASGTGAFAGDDAASPRGGPQADYPQVLGEPFEVEGRTYTPTDELSYDTVGYATLDREGGAGITVSHKTLPLPSYVELTALDSGRTILARAERRGPMTSSRIVGLSPGAARELDVGEGAPVRLRRVNPPEYERSALRSGRAAGSRLHTPDTLLAVLKRQLPESGSTSLLPDDASGDARATAAPRADVGADADIRTASGSGFETDFDQAFTQTDPGASTAAPTGFPARGDASGRVDGPDRITADDREPEAVGDAERSRNTSYALAPIGERPTGATRAAPVEVARMPTPRSVPPATPRSTQPPSQTQAPVARAAPPPPAPVPAQPADRATAASDGRYVVQVASFSSRDNAVAGADALRGFVVRSGNYFRLRTGPFATRGEAEAALARARAAGYRDARIEERD